MNGNLLLNDKPLLIIPTLATTIGLNESIILQQLHYWIKRSTNIREDRKWVYFTYEELGGQFPFFSKSTIRRTIMSLEASEYILAKNFNKMKMDQTKWYTINYEIVNDLQGEENSDEVLQEGEEIPSPKTEEELICSNRTDELLKLDNPSVQNEQLTCSTWSNQMSNLSKAIPEISTEITSENTSETSSSVQAIDNEDDPFRFFEQNGFGKIGNYYAKKMKSWCAELSPEIVIEAMKLALENGSNRWNYVEAVLKDWSNKGYDTVTEIHDARLTYSKQKQAQINRKPIRKELIPEWLVENKLQNTTVIDLDFEAKKKLFEERLKAFC
ncbi:DnaD domain-containing protein [Ferdinandcohnia sp. Marseille-Q9671]